MMNLVVGATGVVGGEMCRLLIERGERVRALVRPSSDAERVNQLRGGGAELALGDLKSRSSLDAACAGIDVVFSTATSLLSRQPSDSITAVDLDGQRSLIDAAVAGGVRRFVFVSALAIEANSIFTDAKLQVEDYLRRSGLDFIVLKASCFMDVWLTPHVGFDAAAGTATLYGDGQRTMRWVLSRDVARVAVDAATRAELAKSTVSVGGPDALSPLEVVAIFESITQRKFQVTHVPVEQLEAQLAGATNPTEQAFAALMLRYAAGDPPSPTALPPGLDVQLMSVREFARRAFQAV